MFPNRFQAHPLGYFILNLTGIFILCIAASLFREPAPGLLAILFLSSLLFSAFAPAKPLLQGTAPALVVATVLMSVFFLGAEGLYPLSVMLVIGLAGIGGIGLVALVGAFAGLGLRRFHWYKRLAKRPSPEIERQKKAAADYADKLRRLAVLTLAFYIQMQIVMPLVSKVVMAETKVTSDEFIENYDPEEKATVLPKTDPNGPPPVQRMPKDTIPKSLGVVYKHLSEEEIKAIEAQCKITGCNVEEEKAKKNGENEANAKNQEEGNEQSEHEKKLEELKNKKLSVEELLKLHKKGEISTKELGALIAEGMKNGSITVWELITNGKQLLGVLNEALGPVTGALLAVILQPGNPHAWNTLIDSLDKQFGGVFHGIKAFKDRAVHSVTDIVNWAIAHPVQAVLAVLGMAGVAILCAFSAPFAIGVMIVGITMAVGGLIWGYATGGWRGLVEQILSKEALAYWDAKDWSGFAGAAVFDVGLFVATNFSDFVAVIGIAGKAGKVLSSVDEMVALANKLTDIRASVDGLLAMGKVTKEGARYIKALTALAYQKSMNTGDLMAKFFLYGDEAFLKNPAFIAGMKEMEDVAALGAQAQRGALEKALKEMQYYMGTQPSYVGIMGQGMGKLDEVVYSNIGKQLGMTDYAAETFIKRGMNVVEGNAKVSADVQRILKGFEKLPAAERLEKEAALVAAIGKYQGKENVLEKILNTNKNIDSKTLNTIGSDSNLLYIVKKGTNSDTEKLINLVKSSSGSYSNTFKDNFFEHIFEGTINSKGQITGFHYEPTGSNAKIIGPIATDPKKPEIYQATVEIAGTLKGNNNGKTTFFPNKWSKFDVIDAIKEAKGNMVWDAKKNKYIGTGKGIKIEMYIDNGKITSANPSWPQ